VAVDLDEVLGKLTDQLEGPRPAEVARLLNAGPDGIARIGRRLRPRFLGHRPLAATAEDAVNHEAPPSGSRVLIRRRRWESRRSAARRLVRPARQGARLPRLARQQA